jgi:hypothetical protein
MFWKREAPGIIRLTMPDGRRLEYEGGAREVLRLFHGVEAEHGHAGLITVVRRDEESGLVVVDSFHNLITNVGKNLDRDGYSGAITDRTLKWVGVGTGTNAPAATDTALGAEALRVAMTSYASGSAGVLTSTANVAPNQLVGTAIGELGWFAGASATATPGSGAMVARVLYSHTKTSTESLSIQRTDTYS